MLTNLQSDFILNVEGTFGEKGKRWLQALPNLLNFYSKKWDLSDLKTFSNLSYNYVVKANKGEASQPVVLKLGVPSKELSREILALNCYNGIGAPKVIANDIENGVFLLEFITPGNTLKDFFPHNDQTAIYITAEVIKKLHACQLDQSKPFPNIREWHASLYKTQCDRIHSDEILTHAMKLSDQLIQSQKNLVLLHGDLHHENILFCGERKWLAIDPKGLLGEAAYEVGAFIRNPIPELLEQPNALEIISDRITAFANLLNIDRKRIVDWSFVQAILSACWSMEESNDSSGQYFIKCAKLLLKV